MFCFVFFLNWNITHLLLLNVLSSLCIDLCSWSNYFLPEYAFIKCTWLTPRDLGRTTSSLFYTRIQHVGCLVVVVKSIALHSEICLEFLFSLHKLHFCLIWDWKTFSFTSVLTLHLVCLWPALEFLFYSSLSSN